MTSNIDLVRSSYEAYARGDRSAALAHMDPDIEMIQTPELPWGGHHRGMAGVAHFFGTLAEHVEATPSIDTFIPAGEDVVAIGRLRGRAKKTGNLIDIAIAHVWTIRHGKAVRFAAYIDTPGMRKALGLD